MRVEPGAVVELLQQIVARAEGQLEQGRHAPDCSGVPRGARTWPAPERDGVHREGGEGRMQAWGGRRGRRRGGGLLSGEFQEPREAREVFCQRPRRAHGGTLGVRGRRRRTGQAQWDVHRSRQGDYRVEEVLVRESVEVPPAPTTSSSSSSAPLPLADAAEAAGGSRATASWSAPPRRKPGTDWPDARSVR